MKVLVTGANGFVGRAVIDELNQRGWQVRGAVRRPLDLPGVELAVVGDIGPATDWRAALQDCEAVIHLAARVHQLDRGAAGDLEAFRLVNVAGSENLARQAVAAGVKRLVFVSTVKVHGEGQANPYRESDPPQPSDAYAVSKWEAEQALTKIGVQEGLELTIIRPPLVYGPAVGANFLRLLRLSLKGLPLPLGGVRNRRSLIYVGNLAHAAAECAWHPAAAGQTFLIADGALATPDLVKAMAAAAGREVWLPALPVSLLRQLARWLGRDLEAQRLLGSLWVDDSALRNRLEWIPPTSLHAALRETVLGHI